MNLLRKLIEWVSRHDHPCSDVTAATPPRCEVGLVRGMRLLEAQRPQQALAEFDHAIYLPAEQAEAFNKRGSALIALGRADEALGNFDLAIKAREGFGDAWYNRSVALYQLHRYEEAITSYRSAIGIDPEDTQAHANCGILLAELRQYEAALDHLNRAIALDPRDARTWFNRGLALAEEGRVEAALESYDEAIKLDPEYAQAHWNRALCHLLLGDFVRGWQAFEWRWRNPELGLALSPVAAPLWLGNGSLQGRTILLRCEQGLGDTLQFCRYAGQVRALGARVILEVQAPLVPLLSGLDGVAQVIALGAELPSFDCYCPLMSLPLALKTSLASIPAADGYLRSDPGLAKVWRERIEFDSALRVGLVWSGGFRPHQPDFNRRRDMPAQLLAKLPIEGMRYYSLQTAPEARAQLAALARGENWVGPEITDLTADLSDFSATAALVSNLDLVISVDTSVAHLAGALGKPVWLLNRHDGCWRWLRDVSSTPWYSSMRIFRQRAPGEWDGVMRQVGDALLNLHLGHNLQHRGEPMKQ